MSRERFDHAIVQELEQELRQALAIEPSPDFARQVRARIGQTSASRVPRALRWSVALAAAAACVIAVGLGWRVTRHVAESPRTGVDVTLAPGSTPVTLSAAVAARLKPGATGALHKTKARVELRGAATRDLPVEPEVIVPPDRARALSRLLELARSGVVDEESLRPVVAASVPATLSVAPIAVPAIPVQEIDIQSGTARGGAIRE